MDLYPAQLDGIALEIEMIDDEIEKSIVRHEFPYRNGALLEDLGQRARSVRFRCYFWDDGADHATYELHNELMSHLETMEVGELVHPKYGPMRGSVESIHLGHDDRDRLATVDITFVQGLIESMEETAREDVQSSVEEAYLASIEEQKLSFAEELGAALGSEAGSILGFELDPDLGIVEQFAGITGPARQYLKTVESYVGTLEGTLNAVANPANSLVSIINYGTTLPGRVIGSVARCVERYARLADGLRTAPGRFADSLSQGMNALSTASGKFSKTTKIGGAAQVAMHVASCYKEDEARRNERKRSEQQPAFDRLGNYTAPDYAATDVQPATVQELESSLATVRGLIQEAVQLDRNQGSLKRMALSLQFHVGTIKLEREKTKRVRLDNTIPLHLLCLQHGLPYTAADRLLAINEIRNPNEVSGEVLIYVN